MLKTSIGRYGRLYALAVALICYAEVLPMTAAGESLYMEALPIAAASDEPHPSDASAERGRVAAAAAGPLAGRLQQLMNAPVLKRSELGIVVYDLTAGKPVYSYQADKLFRPASIEKLITGITALDLLGADHPFTTSVYYTGEVKDSVLHGDLYVVGGFDPEFGEPEMNALVDEVCRLSIRRIDGRVVGDVSMTDSLYYGSGWSWDDATYDFQPCLSPLLFNKGVVKVMASPAVGDTVATVNVTPASTYYTICNQTRCHTSGTEPFRVTRNWLQQGNDILVSGTVKSTQSRTISLYGSADFFMTTFVDRLRERGLTVDSAYCFGELPRTDQSAMMVGQTAHTLQQVITRALKKSDNLSAEAMLRQLARTEEKSSHLSAEDGVTRIQELMKLLGHDPKQYCIVDGSGVSLYNYVTPTLLLDFLKYAYSKPEIYEVLHDALPIAGVDGTLAGRMRGTKAHKRVFAKTGTLTGISSLAGYALTSRNHLLAFVIINQNILKAAEARSFQNRVCAELCK